jgi:hypothetical protein
MNFSYQLYVNRMNYQPFQWPPDISLAELHSRVSEQGPVNDQGVKCPCCGFQSKKKFKGWIMRDIAEVLSVLVRTAKASEQLYPPTSVSSNSTPLPSS